jgi:hypothetical protein
LCRNDFATFDSVYNKLLCNQKQSGQRAVALQHHNSVFHNNICVTQFAEFSGLLSRCEDLAVFKDIQSPETQQLYSVLFCNLIATTRELTLKIINPIIHDKKINQNKT